MSERLIGDLAVNVCEQFNGSGVTAGCAGGQTGRDNGPQSRGTTVCFEFGQLPVTGQCGLQFFGAGIGSWSKWQPTLKDFKHDHAESMNIVFGTRRTG